MADNVEPPVAPDAAEPAAELQSSLLCRSRRNPPSQPQPPSGEADLQVRRTSQKPRRRCPPKRPSQPSFGQVLGYVAEGEPLDIPLPNRKASIYTSSHWYLDDYPNAPEPTSEAPLPQTQLNPAAAFETADEGYDGVPFPRPPREFTRPSFLPDSDDGGMDAGQALRNDGLNPRRPPTLGRRLRESGIQAAETIIAGGAAGAAAASQSFAESRTFNALRGGEDWLDRTLRIPRRPPGLGPPPDEVPPPQIIGRPSEVEPLLERAGQRAAEVERAAAQDIEQFATQQLAEAEASEGFATAAEAAAAGAEAATAAEAGGGALALLGEGALAAAGTVGAAAGGLAVASAGAALVGTAWAIEGGLNAASHMMGWGAATGGGTDSDASRASRATDVQTLNGMQESGAVDHFQVQELRRQQRAQVFSTPRRTSPSRRPSRSNASWPAPPGVPGRRSPHPSASTTLPSRSLPTATAPASAASPARTAGLWGPSRRSTS